MRSKALLVFAVFAQLILITSLAVGAQEDSKPSAFFPQTDYEFSPVLDGEQVEHEFLVQNKGSAVLTIERVKTG